MTVPVETTEGEVIRESAFESAAREYQDARTTLYKAIEAEVLLKRQWYMHEIDTEIYSNAVFERQIAERHEWNAVRRYTMAAFNERVAS